MAQPTPEDRIAIGDLTTAYAMAVDERRYDDLAALFLPDGVIVHHRRDQPATELRTAAGIAEAIQRSQTKLIATNHFLGQQHVADVDGDTATSVTYCCAQHLSDEGGELWNRVMNIRYHDQLRRVDGQWRFVERRLEVDWTEHRRADLKPPTA